MADAKHSDKRRMFDLSLMAKLEGITGHPVYLFPHDVQAITQDCVFAGRLTSIVSVPGDSFTVFGAPEDVADVLNDALNRTAHEMTTRVMALVTEVEKLRESTGLTDGDEDGIVVLGKDKIGGKLN